MLKSSEAMRPATRASRGKVLLTCATLVLALLAAARALGTRVVDDRCLAAAKRMATVAPDGRRIAVGAALAQGAPDGQWTISPRDRDGARYVRYARGPGGGGAAAADDEWVWSCRDEDSIPLLIAESKAAQQLTPERYFP